MSTDSHPNSQMTANVLFDLTGQKAVVTGSGSGIGLMIAQALSTNGATVYIIGRREDALKTVAEKYSKKGSDKAAEIVPVPGDISSLDGIKKLRDRISELAPEGIHLLVNNAGVSLEQSVKFSSNPPDYKDPDSISEALLRSDFEIWQKTFQTNVTAHHFMSAAFLPLLAKGIKKAGRGGGIVNTASVSGVLKTSSGGQFAYAASKAAILQLTYLLGNTFKETGVRVNSIAPGIFPSEMTAGKSDENRKSELKGSGQTLPAKRTGNDQDMAAAILYLAGPGGDFLNGQILYPDGGNMLTSPSSK